MAVQPLHVGGHWQVMNVGWGGPNIAVVTFSFSESTRSFPHFTLQDLPVTGDTFDIFQDTIRVNDGQGSPGVVNPISKEMRKFLYLWSKPPERNGPGSDNVCIGKTLLFFNCGKIFARLLRDDRNTQSFSFKIRTPAGGTESHSDIAYWLWDSLWASSLDDNLAHPYTTGDPFGGPFSIMTIPRAFSTAAEAASYQAVMSPAGFMQVEARTETQTFNNGLSWTTSLTTYSRKVNFPVGEGSATPNWAVEGQERQRDQVGDAANQGSAGSLAAATLKYTIDRRLRCTIERA
jgi:hypothetical protein